MKVNWILSIGLLPQVTAFAPPHHLVLGDRTNRGAARSTRMIRHAGGGIESFVNEQISGISGAISSSVSVPPELLTLANDVYQALLQALPAGVDQKALHELVDAAVTPYHLVAIGVFALASSFMLFLNTPEDFSDAPFEPGTNTYDPKASEKFYGKRPLMVIKRILKLALLTGSFNSGILFDWLVLGKLFKDEEYTALKRNEPRRAKLALSLCEQLGPTFISKYPQETFGTIGVENNIFTSLRCVSQNLDRP